MNIRTKLSLGFSVMGLLILIAAAVAYFNISSLQTDINLLSKDRLPKIVWANQVIDQINIGARGLRNALLTDSQAETQEQLDRVLQTTKVVGPLFDSLKATITSDEGIKLLESIDEVRPEYINVREKIFSYIKAGDKAAATNLLFTDFRTVQTQYFDRVANIIEFQTKLMVDSANEAEDTAATAIMIILITLVVSIIIGIITSSWISKIITNPINRAVDAANNIAKGNTKVNLDNDNKDETGLLLNAMKTMANNITRLSDELNKTADAAVMGKLDNRGDENAFEGDYKEIIRGFNATLDAVIGPLNVTAEYVDRISKGDIPPRIIDNYNGDFNEIKNNLNQCIDAVNLLVKDAGMLSKAAKDGKLDTRADANRHHGDFRAIVQGVNATLDNVIGPLNVAAEYVDRISKGDIPPKITDNYNGDFNEIKNNLNGCIDAVNALVTDAKMLSKAAIEGKLDTRADASRHGGDFRAIVEGVNATLDNVIGPLNVAAEYVDRIAKGDIPPKITDNYNGDFNEIKNNLNGCIDAVNALVTDAKMLSKAAIEGKLDTRADATKHGGDFRAIVEGVNATLDNVIGPLNVAAEYVDRISKGDIPPKITDNYNGDFNEIKNNLNGCIDSLNGLIDEMKHMSKQHDLGDIDVVVNVDRFTGAYNEMAHGVNDMVNGHISVKKKAMACFMEFGEGNLDAKIEQFPGKKKFINETIEIVRANIKELVKDAAMLSKAAIEGKLDTRADATKHKGDFRAIVQGVNDTLDNVIGPLNVAANYVDRISKGDIPDVITDNYNGDFNILKNNLNTCIRAVDALVADAKMLAKAAVDGKLDTRADATKHHGDFREIVQGVNSTLDNVIGPLNVAAEYVDRISKGDIPPKITDNYNGDFNEIKNNLNQAIDAVNMLVTDALMLVDAAERGALQTRADVTHHHGDFRKIVDGVNKTLDMVVNPIDETSTIMSIFATGDLTSRILSEYNGDFAKLKNDINKFAESLSDLIMQLTDSIQNTASAAHEISSTAESLAAATQEQSAQADEVANAVEAMSRTITENAMSASRTADVANKNSTMASESGKVVELTVNKMKDIAVVVKNSATNIEQLGESSKQIGEIISVIDDIADQTNLLALNAAIEAARAGEQGRGFAVVADEVRKLAERTTEATKQIAKMIKGIQHETEQAVVAMNKGTMEVQSGIELADKAGESLKQILTSTHEVLDMVNQIAAASEEQSATSEQISKNVIAISKVTADSTSRVEDVAKTADELARMTEQLRDLISSFKVNESGRNFGSGRMLSSRDGKQLTSGW